MPTLAQLIADHEQRQPQPVETPACAVITPRGHAALTICRLADQLVELEPDERTACLKLLRDLVAGDTAS